jgi:hypothetical protein
LHEFAHQSVVSDFCVVYQEVFDARSQPGSAGRLERVAHQIELLGRVCGQPPVWFRNVYSVEIAHGQALRHAFMQGPVTPRSFRFQF